MRRGPKASTSMPMMMRAGMVSATFRISSIFTCWSLSPKASRIDTSSGAWLNQTKKDRKNANQVRCRIWYLPENENSLSLDSDMVAPSQ
jgi:hypothetical protein